METAERTPDITHAHLRIARPSDNRDAVLAFYRDGLVFELLARFEDHDGFDGIMLGHPEAEVHTRAWMFRRTRADDGGPAYHLFG